MSGSTFTNLVENQVYRLGNLYLEAAFCEVWTLIVLTDKGEHVRRRHGALVAYQLRTDGLWDTLHDCYTSKRPAGKAWCLAYGSVKQINFEELQYVAENRAALQSELEDQEIDQAFRELMATMEWVV